MCLTELSGKTTTTANNHNFTMSRLNIQSLNFDGLTVETLALTQPPHYVTWKLGCNASKYETLDILICFMSSVSCCISF